MRNVDFECHVVSAAKHGVIFSVATVMQSDAQKYVL